MGQAVNELFGARVRSVMDAGPRGKLSLRQTTMRTGVDIDTLSRMRAGVIPRVDKIESFAAGFGLDVNDWRELAGYPRLDQETPQQRFWRRFGEAHARLAAEGIHLPAPAFDRDYPGWDNLSDADIDHTLDVLEQMARQGPPAPPAVPPPEALDDLALRLADIARQIRSAQPRPPETRLTTGTIPPE